MARFSKRQLKAYRKQYYSSNTKKALQLKRLNYKCNADARKESDREAYESRSAPKRQKMRRYNALNTVAIRSAMRDAYASNPAPQKEAVKQRYASNPAPKKEAVKTRYASNPMPQREAARRQYRSNPLPQKEAARRQYRSNPAPQKFAVKKRYASNPGAQKNAARVRYLRHRSAILLGRRKQYYASLLCRRASRLWRHTLHRSQENKKNRAYSKQNKQKISIAQKARYYLTEPKADKKELYVQNLKKSISSQSALRKKLLRAFKVSRQPLAEKIKESKLAKAVLNIASRKSAPFCS